MPVIDVTSAQNRAEGVARAVQAVQEGGIVVLPTDTVYGVGVDAFNPEAVAALQAAKHRGREVPPPVLVADARTVDGLATDIPEYARHLMDACWPGPLTLILKAQRSLMWDLGETNGTVGVRMPDEPIALDLLRQTGPMAVTSANLHGQPAATTVLDAATMLGAAVDVYLDAGPSAQGQASTIVDCTGAEPVLLRHGGVSEADVRRIAAGPGTPTEGVAGNPGTE
ncbi:putative threonylcarbamoyl-AMP synthase [Austwickia sp. TVS 96-490-7B]|uniref:L-threonylcarbamoyladenylate synthase n=1 Tax=Austwickia sp. TVS 96-490-7B TaxID=2830843 RepID=UPI001C5657F7|nr:L-threonylcarbamoyladenylate synthase [Austwickia sp. TVS 96-490-7B]MBW3084601.1 putative threonylcarbamoyl-AMP synthase [Austwickia sp. TVS 96-490-7B]